MHFSAQGPAKIHYGRVGRYNLDYYDAKRFCNLFGTTLATYSQLYAAWQAGFEHCQYVDNNPNNNDDDNSNNVFSALSS